MSLPSPAKSYPCFLHAAIVILLLAGCAGQSGQPPRDRDWQDRSVQLQGLSHWQATGKMALRNAERSESASMAWSQAANETHLNLSGPLGLSATTLRSDGKILEVTRAGDTRRYDISTAESTVAQTRWDLPIQALHHWLKGVPAPQLAVQQLDIENGLLRQLSQAGWLVTYDDYGQFGPYTLPTRLHIERAQTRARLIIRSWTVDSA